MKELHVLFVGAFEDDAVWNNSGDLEAPAGRSIASSLVRVLQQRGIACSDVWQRDYYGWEFHITIEGTHITAVLQHVDKWLIVLRGELSLKGTTNTPLWNTARAIERFLLEDGRCSQVRVMTESESPY